MGSLSSLLCSSSGDVWYRNYSVCLSRWLVCLRLTYGLILLFRGRSSPRPYYSPNRSLLFSHSERVVSFIQREEINHLPPKTLSSLKRKTLSLSQTPRTGPSRTQVDSFSDFCSFTLLLPPILPLTFLCLVPPSILPPTRYGVIYERLSSYPVCVLWSIDDLRNSTHIHPSKRS